MTQAVAGRSCRCHKANVAWLCACVCHCGLTGNMREFDEHGNGALFQLPPYLSLSLPLRPLSVSLPRLHCLTNARSSYAVFWVGVYGALGATANYVVHSHTHTCVIIYMYLQVRKGHVVCLLLASRRRRLSLACEHVSLTDWSAQVSLGLGALGSRGCDQWAMGSGQATNRAAIGLFIHFCCCRCRLSFFSLAFCFSDLKLISFIGMLSLLLLFIVDIVCSKARM